MGLLLVNLFLFVNLVTLLPHLTESPNLTEESTTNVMKSSINRIKTTKLTDAPIGITHNDNFTLYASSGNGTEINPYLLTDLTIDGAGGSGISINNTDAYFVIQNSVITIKGTEEYRRLC